MTGRMTAADTVCCTSNEEFGGRILKHPFLHFSHSLSESISHASFRCSSRREEPSDMTLNVDFTPCHSCKLINLDLTSGFHQPLWPLHRSRAALSCHIMQHWWRGRRVWLMSALCFARSTRTSVAVVASGQVAILTPMMTSARLAKVAVVTIMVLATTCSRRHLVLV